MCISIFVRTLLLMGQSFYNNEFRVAFFYAEFPVVILGVKKPKSSEAFSCY